MCEIFYELIHLDIVYMLWLFVVLCTIAIYISSDGDVSIIKKGMCKYIIAFNFLLLLSLISSVVYVVKINNGDV